MSDSLDAVVDKALLELQNPQGSPMESIMAIRQVLEIDPNHLKANFTLGALSFSTGQYERAIERMSKVVEIAPETEEAYKILVESYNNLGRVDSAESTVRAYMSRFPEGQFIQEFQKIINN
ncbi:MAG: tetratricopeptide repeat protein [Thermaurantimonas sp.]